MQEREQAREAAVAPARERGLKYDYGGSVSDLTSSRSREGAWIEITSGEVTLTATQVAPARERGLKSAPLQETEVMGKVAPARERGLKYLCKKQTARHERSLPRGSVD